VSTPVGEVVKELNRYRPEVLVSYASVIAALAEEQLRGLKLVRSEADLP
jgi:ferric-dicitrate binding protein FerR (iron transport regulator)